MIVVCCPVCCPVQFLQIRVQTESKKPLVLLVSAMGLEPMTT